MLPLHISVYKLERCRFEQIDYSADEELVGWSQPEGCGQWIYVQMEAKSDLQNLYL